jgi:hypothetical protein
MDLCYDLLGYGTHQIVTEDGESDSFGFERFRDGGKYTESQGWRLR